MSGWHQRSKCPQTRFDLTKLRDKEDLAHTSTVTTLSRAQSAMSCMTELQVQCRLHGGSTLPVAHRARAKSQAVQRVQCSQRTVPDTQSRVCGCAKATAALVAQQLLCAQLAGASEAVSGVADAGSSTLPLALGGGAAIAALSAALISTDPQKRCVPFNGQFCSIEVPCSCVLCDILLAGAQLKQLQLVAMKRMLSSPTLTQTALSGGTGYMAQPTT